METGDLEYLEGYDLEDSFIDQNESSISEEFLSTGAILRPKYEGFFINAGDIEFVPEDEFSVSQLDPLVVNNKNPIDPEIESAIHHLQSAAKGFTLEEGKFPKSLEPYLSEVAVVAQKNHPKGYITNDVVTRLTQFLPFQANSLRNRMKRLVKKESSTPNPNEEKNKN